MPAECFVATQLQLGTYAIEFLRLDTRPTFIVFVPTNYATSEPATVVFANDALRDIERRGEISMGWVLSEGFLRHGEGTFPTNKWRFTTLEVGSGKGGTIMAVTAEGIPMGEWDFNGRTSEVNGMGHPALGGSVNGRKQGGDRVTHAVNGDVYRSISMEGDKSKETGTPEVPALTPGTLSIAICKEQERERERKEAAKESEPVSRRPSSARTRSLVQPFAAASSNPQIAPLQQQLSGPFMDWTQGISPLQTSEHYRNLRNVDWSKTSCGPYHTWSTCLRLVACSIMTIPYPTTFYWGPEYTIIYNEEWRKIAQNKDPNLLGKSFAEGWPELKNYFLPLLDAAYLNGQGTVKEAEQFFVHRGEGIEECYFNFSISAVVGEDGTPEGVLEQAFEHTRRVVSARRMATLQRMGELLVGVKDLDEDNFWKILLESFDDNPLDSPFLLIYRTVGQEQSHVDCSTFDEICCSLEGNIGFPEGGYLAPLKCNLKEECGYFSGEMKVAKETNSVVLKEFDLSNVEGADKIVYRGFGDTPKHAVIIPIQATKTITQGFLILGLNPMRPYDGDYKLWINLLKKELATTAGRVRLLKGEIVKAITEETQRVAKLQAVELQKQLEKRTAELRDSELLFTRTAETIPVGLVLLNPNGKFIFQNEAYFKLTTLSPGCDGDDWRQVIYHEDRPRVYALFEKATSSNTSMQWETRIAGGPSDSQGWKYWVTCSIVAQTNRLPNGEEQLTGYIMTVVDITSIKMNEEYQRQLSTQAVERRRQQENFIDVFSHELRNPFSATLQCADGILSALMEYQSSGERGHELDVEEMIDSASTILVCVQHQMRIIDDVLTLSKLDSMLLSVVPVDIQIHETVSQIMKIFQSELQVKGITSQYLLEDSCKELKIDWIKADPSRFSQILMNLITNAIKFTSLQAGRREIITRLGASLKRPTGHGTVTYRDSDQARLSQDVAHPDWGSGETVYILVTVQDSGIGISEEWQKKLFKRFEQVPRTHVTYGGSGLGLFICRQLCRIQGGEIGVYSEEGQGSSFSFYIKARRSTGPSNPLANPHTQPISSNRKLSKFEELATGSGGEGAGVVTVKTYPVPKALELRGTTREQVSYNVLIVEDNLINQEVLRRQLRKEGCVTHVAGNGKEALKFISESVFVKEGGVNIDIVLMDMEMPVMDGNTATLKIREMERSGRIKKHVPIMGISANARPEQVAKMTEAGMDDAISKPFRIVDLLVRFDSLLRKLQECGPNFPDAPDPASGNSRVKQ